MELEALLQKAKHDSIPAFLLFLADGAVVSLECLCHLPCLLTALKFILFRHPGHDS